MILLSSAGSGLVDFAIALVILLAMMGWYGIGWTFSLFLAPRLIAGMVFIACRRRPGRAQCGVSGFPLRHSVHGAVLTVCDPVMKEVVLEAGRAERHYWFELWQYRELFRVSGLA